MQCKLSPKSTFKPQLETLEERANPSFLLSGNAVPQMAAPLNAIVADMKATANDLTSAVNFANQQPNNSTQLGKALVVAVSDYQRLLTEQRSVLSTSSADQTFINSVAFAEFQSGDAGDLEVLFFGKFLSLAPLQALTDPVDQANGVMQSNDVQGDANYMHNVTFGGISVLQYTQTPNF